MDSVGISTCGQAILGTATAPVTGADMRAFPGVLGSVLLGNEVTPHPILASTVSEL